MKTKIERRSLVEYIEETEVTVESLKSLVQDFEKLQTLEIPQLKEEGTEEGYRRISVLVNKDGQIKGYEIKRVESYIGKEEVTLTREELYS